MKITIDLQDPDIQRQLQLAIDEKITALAAERVQAAIDGVIATKMERLTDKRMDELVAAVLSAGVRVKLESRPAYNTPTMLEAVLREETKKMLREALGRP